MQLVTLQEASDHLRRDTSDDDSDLLLKVRAASTAVITYLGSGKNLFEPEYDADGNIVTDTSGSYIPATDSSGNKIVRFDVKAATLLLIGEFYKNREAEQDGPIDAQYGYGYLPRPVVALLYPLRTPAVR